jgi:hypothetical protein
VINNDTNIQHNTRKSKYLAYYFAQNHHLASQKIYPGFLPLSPSEIRPVPFRFTPFRMGTKKPRTVASSGTSVF